MTVKRQREEELQFPVELVIDAIRVVLAKAATFLGTRGLIQRG